LDAFTETPNRAGVVIAEVSTDNQESAVVIWSPVPAVTLETAVD
jgi:hypothetical protein